MNILDIIGPIMIGPSSSHTAGAVRLALLAKNIFNEPITKAEIFLHGSFADTYKGHGTDLALIAGLLGCKPDDANIPHAYKLAQENNLDITIAKINLGELAHPNSVKFILHGHNSSCEVIGCSLGGGRVLISDIDGFTVDINGQMPILLTVHTDKPGIIALVSSILSNSGINIAQMKVFRQNRGGLASMVIEIDQIIDTTIVQAITTLPNIQKVRSINNVI